MRQRLCHHILMQKSLVAESSGFAGVTAIICQMEKFEVHLVVHEAKKLVAADRGGTSDPYCQVKVEKQLFKTEVVKKSLNPVWNETFEFSARVTTKDIVFEVYDHDLIGSHDFLGGIELDLHSLELDTAAQKPSWYDLTTLGRDEKVAGSLRLSITVKRVTVQFEDITKGLALKPLMPDATVLALAKSKGQSCCVLNVVACQDIVAADSDGGSDPFIVVHAGPNTCQTKTLDSLNPVFNEVFTLPLERGVSSLRFNLFDYDVLGSNDFLGCLVVSLSDMIVDKVVDKWEFLCQRKDDDEVSGRIRVIVKLLLPLPLPVFQPVALEAKPGYGLLQLYVQCATNLVAADSGGTSDPYFEVSAGDFKFKSEHKSRTLDPVFDATVDVLVQSGVQVVSVSLWDYDLMSANDFLGYTTINIGSDNCCMPESLISKELQCLSKEEPVRGSISLSYRWIELPPPVELPDPLAPHLSKGTGYMQVMIVAATNLIGMDSSGLSDPYVMVDAGKNNYKTSHKDKTLNPVWLECLDVLLPAATSFITFSVFDFDLLSGNDIIGTGSLELENIAAGSPAQSATISLKNGERGDAGTLFVKYAMLKECSKVEELSWNEDGRDRDFKSSKGIGCLHVGLYSARDLVACDVNGYSDPFIQVSVGAELLKSKVVKKSINPTFNEAMIVDVQPGACVVEIQVYDHDLVGSNEFMGQVLFPISQLVVGEEKRSKFTLCTRSPGDNVSGTIEISLCLTVAPVDPVIEYPPHSIELLQDRQRKNGSGCIRVGLISARELMAADSNGFSDPFARIQVGSDSQKSKVVKRNLHPIFCEGFLFELPVGTPAINVTLFDHDRVGSSDFLGCCNFPLGDVSEGLTVKKWLPLRGRKADETVSGYVQLHVTVIMAPLPLKPKRADDKNLVFPVAAQWLGAGIMEIVSLCARDLCAMDDAVALSDPFVAVSCTEGNSVKCEPISSTCNPVWNSALVLRVPAGQSMIQVQVFDQDRFGSDSMGSVYIDISSLEVGNYTEGWHLLSGKDDSHTVFGAIRLGLCLHRQPASSQSDASSWGMMKLAVDQGRDLLVHEQSSTFVEIDCSGSRTLSRAEVGCDPIWRWQTTLEVPKGCGVLRATLKQLHSNGIDTIRLGYVALFIAEIDEGREYDEWYSLQSFKPDDPVSGSVRIKLVYERKCQGALGALRPSDATIPGASTRVPPVGVATVSIIAARRMRAKPVRLLRVVVQVRVGVTSVRTKPKDFDGEASAAAARANVVMLDDPTRGSSSGWKVSQPDDYEGGELNIGEVFELSIPHPSCVLELALFGHGGGGNDTVSGVAQIPLRVLPEETVLSKWVSFAPRDSTVVSGQVLLRVIITNQSSFRSPEGYENGLPQGCPWQCGVTLYPRDLDKHLVCCPNSPDPSAIIACPNAVIGCPVVARRDLVAQHTSSCIFEPVKDILALNMKDCRELRGILHTKQRDIEELRLEVSQLKGEVARLRPLVAEYSETASGLGAARNEPVLNGFKAQQRAAANWDPQQCVAVLHAHTDSVQTLCLGGSEFQVLMSGGRDGAIRFWDNREVLPSVTVCVPDAHHHLGVMSLASAGDRLVSGGCDSEAAVWRVTGPSVIKLNSLEGHSSWVHGVIFLGDCVITASHDRTIKLWDCRRRTCITTVTTGSRGVYGMAVVGHELVTSVGNSLCAWDLRQLSAGVATNSVPGVDPAMESLTGNRSGVWGHFAHSEKLYAIAPDSSVRLWDVKHRACRLRMEGHTDYVRAVAYAGGRLFSAGDDKTLELQVRMWETVHHDCIRVLTGHTGYINALLAARGRIYSAGNDKTIRVWE